MQQVIDLPICNDSRLFYRRRLSTYNFTIYNLRTKECHCFAWHEGVSTRGACEVATCLYIYLCKLDDENVEEVYLFADGCPGQNKNSIVAAMLLYAVIKSKHIKIITLNFFESHHGQSEGDAAHSTISTALKTAGDVFVLSQLLPIFKLARYNKPYIVQSLTHRQFLDFKNVAITLKILSVRKDDRGEGVDWTIFKELMVKKNESEKIFFKDSNLSTCYRSITLQRRGAILQSPKLLNLQPRKISAQKYADLMALC